MLSISLVVSSSCFYRLLGIVGLPLLHLYGLQTLLVARVMHLFPRGFCCSRVLTRPPFSPCVW